jgi:hypothetical protein
MSYFQPSFTDPRQSIPSYTSDPFLNGYGMTITSSTTLNLAAGGARAYTNDFAIVFAPIQTLAPSFLELDISTVGPLGCYPRTLAQSLATDGSLGVYVQGDTSGKNPTTAIVCTGDDFLLPGYDVWRRVATVYIDISALQLIPMNQDGTNFERTYTLITSLNVVTAAANTAAAAMDFHTGIFPCNPALTERILLNAAFAPAAPADLLLMSSSSLLPVASQYVIQSPVAGQATAAPIWLETDNLQNFTTVYRKNSAPGCSATINFAGWRETMGLNAI